MGSMIVAAPYAGFGEIVLFAGLMLILLPVLLAFSVCLSVLALMEMWRILREQTRRERLETCVAGLCWLAVMAAAAVAMSSLSLNDMGRLTSEEALYRGRMMMAFCQLPFVLYCYTGRKYKGLQFLQLLTILCLLALMLDNFRFLNGWVNLLGEVWRWGLGNLFTFWDFWGVVIFFVVSFLQIWFFRRNDPDWVAKQKRTKYIIRRPQEDKDKE